MDSDEVKPSFAAAPNIAPSLDDDLQKPVTQNSQLGCQNARGTNDFISIRLLYLLDVTSVYFVV